MLKLYPKLYIKSAFDLDLKYLKGLGIKCIIFDVDNTLVPYFIEKPDKNVIKLFDKIQNMGMKIAVLSNGKEKRVKKFLEDYNFPYEYRAKKPSSKKLRLLMDRLKFSSNEVALVGDQIFTDVWCANKVGVYSIFTEKVSKKDEFITLIKRPIEWVVLKMYFKSVKK